MCSRRHPSMGDGLRFNMKESHVVRMGELRYILLAVRIIIDFGAVIAVPVVVLAHAGKLLDSAFGTSPWLTVAGFVLAALMTAVVVRRRASFYGRKYQALIDSEGSSSS